MKFDFAIGNPPYQEETENNGRQNPVYHHFMDEAYKLADCVEFITPARFLFNAGQTPKAWNEKMLQDEHFKVLKYESDASNIFPNTDIKGGVAITYRDKNKNFGAINVFTSYNELNEIVKKVTQKSNKGLCLNSIIASQGLYRFSELFFDEHPESKNIIGAGTGNKIVSSVIEKLPHIFLESVNNTDLYIKFWGRIKNQRVYRYIRRDYLVNNQYIDSYNLFLPEANNSGVFGETLTEPFVGHLKCYNISTVANHPKI